MSTRITGIGSYLPERILTNADLEKMVETTDEWIVTRTGMKERHIAREDETASSMGAEAAKKAMADAGITAEAVGMIIVATATPDMNFPSTACIIQGLVGAKNAICFDISVACAGFVYGVEIARKFLESGSMKNVLVIGAEKYSTIVDWKDRDTCVLFADGAGAAVISKGDTGRGIIASYLGADGTFAGALNVPAKIDRSPFMPVPDPIVLPHVVMNGKDVFKNAVRWMAESCVRALDQAGLTADQMNLVVPHQANIRIMEAVADRLKVPMSKVYLNLHKVGNISAASIPVAVDDAVQAGALKRGDLLLVVAFGAGFTWGAMVIEW